MLADTEAIRRRGQAPPELGKLILGPRVLDVGEQLSALPHQVEAPAKEVAGRTHRGRVDVRLWQ